MKGKKISFFLLFLEVAFLLHDVPALGDLYPPSLYAALVLLLFFILSIRVEENRLLAILPIFLLPILDLFLKVVISESLLVDLQLISGFIQLMIYPLIAIDVLHNQMIRKAKVLILFFLSIIIITCYTSFEGLQLYPGAIREIVGGNIDPQLWKIYRSMNIGGFDLVYSVLFIEILLIYTVKTINFYSYSVIILLLCVIALLLSFVFLVTAEFTMAIILFVLFLFSLLITKRTTLKTIFLFSVVAYLLYLRLEDTIADKIFYISEIIESDNISHRLRDLSALLTGQKTSMGSDVDGRLDLYMTSLNSFITNPLGCWSINNEYVGGHSYFFDSLAKYGLLGLLLIYTMIKCLYNNYVKNYNNYQYGFSVVILFLFVVTAIVNPHIYLEFILFVVPLFFMVSSSYYKKNNQ